MDSSSGRLERRIDSLQTALEEIRNDPRGDLQLHRVEERLLRRMDRLQESIDAIRSDLTHIALGGGFLRKSSSV